MEISRVKMIENENSRLHQAIDKSNRGKVKYYSKMFKQNHFNTFFWHQ